MTEEQKVQSMTGKRRKDRILKGFLLLFVKNREKLWGIVMQFWYIKLGQRFKREVKISKKAF